MAIMLPTRVSADATGTEQRIFGRLRDGLSDEWHAIHSLNFAHHPRKPWAEIDFVLVGPPGVFCLEVKGGLGISVSQGQWIYTSKAHAPITRTESPFAQVGSASAALHKWLRKHDAPPGLMTGWGVMFPNYRFEITGPEIEPELVYDVHDEAAPILQFIERMVEYWQAKLGRSSVLSESQVRQVVDLLSPEFNIVRGLRSQIAEARESLLQLTEEQAGIVENLSLNERVIITGVAGTGKTLIALNEAERLASEGKRVLLCCFNRHLATRLSGATNRTDLQITTLHTEMRRLVEAAGGDATQPDDYSDDDYFQLYLPYEAIEALRQMPEEAYDAIVVDEAQDILSDSYVQVLDALVRNGLSDGIWRVLFDPFQNTYNSIGPGLMERLQQSKPATWQLNVNCRNTRPIAVTTAQITGAPLAKTLKVDGPQVEIHFYRDSGDQARQVSRLLGRILSDKVTPDQITLLGPRSFDRSTVASADAQLPVLITPFEKAAGQGAVGYSSIGAFKGLESDVVIITDVEHLVSELAATALYVGMSRAVAHLEIFIDQRAKPEHQQVLANFGERFARGT